jgi:hypothetical protein
MTWFFRCVGIQFVRNKESIWWKERVFLLPCLSI